ncbi:MAG: hypothetical protein RBU21_23185 [FCB group bacterium]|jgi:hypothetical protein|nr:hypothetical protein [FCB group bacterium]
MNRLLLVLALLGPVVCTGCKGFAPFEVDLPILAGGTVSDEEVIAAILDDVQEGMQRRQVYRILAHVSRNYRDAEGRDYKAMQEYLKESFALYRDIRITRVPPRIEVRGYGATAIETFGTTAEPFDPNKAPHLQIQGQVTVRFEKVDNRWLIVEWGNVQ